ncbi:MAG: Hsp20/alpha crystallin family protein [Deferribacterales bacterium]
MSDLSSFDKIILIHGITDDPDNLLTKVIKEFFDHGHFPPVDISLRSDSVIVWIELAGVKQENVKIFLYEDLLVIEGIVRPEKAAKYNYLRVERMSNPFRRVIKLPVKIDSKTIEAKFENGVFKIEFKRMPKEFVTITLNGGKGGTAN